MGHVQKRLGTRLRKLKSAYTKRKLADGKSIGERGRFTDRMIDTMQNYYGLAIHKNKHDLSGMKNDYHLASSKDIPTPVLHSRKGILVWLAERHGQWKN